VASNAQIESDSLDLARQSGVARRRHSAHYVSFSRLVLAGDLVAILTSTLSVTGH